MQENPCQKHSQAQRDKVQYSEFQSYQQGQHCGTGIPYGKQFKSWVLHFQFSSLLLTSVPPSTPGSQLGTAIWDVNQWMKALSPTPPLSEVKGTENWSKPSSSSTGHQERGSGTPRLHARQGLQALSHDSLGDVCSYADPRPSQGDCHFPIGTGDKTGLE